MTAAALPEPLPHAIRPMAAGDEAFVFETSVKVRWPQRSGLPWGEWSAMHGPEVRRRMEAGTVLVVDADVLLGFVVVSEGAVHMLYVKRDFRGLGLGAELLAATALPVPLRVYLPTPSWRRWCELRGIAWTRTT